MIDQGNVRSIQISLALLAIAIALHVVALVLGALQ